MLSNAEVGLSEVTAVAIIFLSKQILSKEQRSKLLVHVLLFCEVVVGLKNLTSEMFTFGICKLKFFDTVLGNEVEEPMVTCPGFRSCLRTEDRWSREKKSKPR